MVNGIFFPILVCFDREKSGNPGTEPGRSKPHLTVYLNDCFLFPADRLLIRTAAKEQIVGRFDSSIFFLVSDLEPML
jgi:hypothetical protein